MTGSAPHLSNAAHANRGCDHLAQLQSGPGLGQSGQRFDLAGRDGRAVVALVLLPQLQVELMSIDEQCDATKYCAVGPAAEARRPRG